MSKQFWDFWVKTLLGFYKSESSFRAFGCCYRLRPECLQLTHRSRLTAKKIVSSAMRFLSWFSSTFHQLVMQFCLLKHPFHKARFGQRRQVSDVVFRIGRVGFCQGEVVRRRPVRRRWGEGVLSRSWTQPQLGFQSLAWASTLRPCRWEKGDLFRRLGRLS